MRTQRIANVLLCSTLTFTLVGLVACGGGEPEHPDVVKPVASQPAGGGMDQGMGQSAQSAGSGQLDIQLPDSWVKEPPANSMRMLQARVPGDAGDGQLAVFYFGPGGGGGVEQNIQRWLGQVQPAEGSQPARDTFETNGLTVHTVEAKGTITPSRMSMTAEAPEPEPDSMLLGAVVEGPGGPWFIKLTGPAATLESQHEAFTKMINDLTVAQGG
jgi:hypothetical protein